MILKDYIGILKSWAQATSQQMLNKANGLWYKAGGTITATGRTKDYEVFDAAARRAVFSTEEHGQLFMKSLTASQAAGESMKNKLTTYQLSSLANTVNLRYSTRIRHFIATGARAQNLYEYDLDTIYERIVNVG
jgi:hypothetical protein